MLLSFFHSATWCEAAKVSSKHSAIRGPSWQQLSSLGERSRLRKINFGGWPQRGGITESFFANAFFWGVVNIFGKSWPVGESVNSIWERHPRLCLSFLLQASCEMSDGLLPSINWTYSVTEWNLSCLQRRLHLTARFSKNEGLKGERSECYQKNKKMFYLFGNEKVGANGNTGLHASWQKKPKFHENWKETLENKEWKWTMLSQKLFLSAIIHSNELIHFARHDHFNF